MDHEEAAIVNPEKFEDRNSERSLSLQLFSLVKPVCVELTQIVLLPSPIFKADNPKIETCLCKIASILESHHEAHKKSQLYRLATNVADYIFFPISNLLKHEDISHALKISILKIVCFLIEYAWVYHANARLLEQFAKLVANLIVQVKKDEDLYELSSSLKLSIIDALSLIFDVLPTEFFSQDDKTLTNFGIYLSTMLDLIASIQQPMSEKEIEAVNLTLKSICRLHELVHKEHASKVFPGTFSKLISYFCSSKNLNYTIIVTFIGVIEFLLVNTFKDSDLKLEWHSTDIMEPWKGTLQDLLKDYTNSEVESYSFSQIQVEIKEKGHGKNWLENSTQEVKKALVIFFRKLLFTSSYKIKLASKNQISEKMIHLFSQLFLHCYLSLNRTVIPMSFDILALLIANTTHGAESRRRSDLINYVSDEIFLSTTGPNEQVKLKLLKKQIENNISETTGKNVSRIFFSNDEDKMEASFILIQLQFKVFMKLDDNLSNSNLKYDLLISLKNALVDNLTSGGPRKQSDRTELLNMLERVNIEDSSSSNELYERENYLDGVRLPPYVDSKKVVNLKPKNVSYSKNSSAYIEHLQLISNNWKNGTYENRLNHSNYFHGIYTAEVENNLSTLFHFIGEELIKNDDELLTSLEFVFELDNHFSSQEQCLLRSGIALWISNCLLRSRLSNRVGSSDAYFKIEDFLDIPEDDIMGGMKTLEAEEMFEESSYLLLGKAKEILDVLDNKINLPYTLSKSDINQNKIHSLVYSIALDTIGSLSQIMPLEDFRYNCIQNFMYPILEALTFQNDPLVQSHAYDAVDCMVRSYYQYDIRNLIKDNQDYILDSLSVKLSISESLNPSIGGILLILFKISGLDLFSSGKLADIFSKIFVLIDTLHGYSSLVEVFFMVFRELVVQIKHTIDVDADVTEKSHLKDTWNIMSIGEALNLLDEDERHEKIIYENFDSSKEYFLDRASDSFEDTGADSDDEDVSQSEHEEDVENCWTSVIPKDIYLNIQRIFTYGTRLLTHPSSTLKIRILETLSHCYPLLATNYPLLLPLTSQIWPSLVVLVTGANSLSQYNPEKNFELESENITIHALQLMSVLLDEETRRGESFLGRRFVDFWTHFKQHSHIYKRVTSKSILRGKVEIEAHKASLVGLSEDTKYLGRPYIRPDLGNMYVKFVLQGISTYRKAISESDALDMIKFCKFIGIPSELTLSRDIKSLVWVVQQGMVHTALDS